MLQNVMLQNVMDEARARRELALAREQVLLLRIGGVCAVAGALIFVLSLAGHGDLPTHVSHVAGLQFIVDQSNWLLMHLGTILAGLLWIFAVAALAGTFTADASRALARLMVPSAVVGGIFLIFNYAVDGYAFKILANEWATSSGAQRANLEQAFDTILVIASGTLRAELLLFYGVTMLLTALAVTLDGAYPRWFGSIGAVASGLATLVALSSFLGLSFRVDVLVFVVALPLEGLWLLVLGLLMWRRGGRVQENAEPA
jgi:hypothetical protein